MRCEKPRFLQGFRGRDAKMHCFIRFGALGVSFNNLGGPRGIYFDNPPGPQGYFKDTPGGPSAPWDSLELPRGSLRRIASHQEPMTQRLLASNWPKVACFEPTKGQLMLYASFLGQKQFFLPTGPGG